MRRGIRDSGKNGLGSGEEDIRIVRIPIMAAVNIYPKYSSMFPRIEIGHDLLLIGEVHAVQLFGRTKELDGGDEGRECPLHQRQPSPVFPLLIGTGEEGGERNPRLPPFLHVVHG